jgi:outer membrane protein assembly factor BamE (lipoprotein component of BamABCDE complex)
MVTPMKRTTNWLLLLIVAVVTISIAVLLLRQSADITDPPLAEAIAEFKANPGFRQKVANKVLPHLEAGMTKEEVESVLGRPDRTEENPRGVRWHYSLFYSMFVNIQFDHDGTLSSLDACADSTTDTRPAGSGLYRIGPG